MKRSNAIHALGMLLFAAAYSASVKEAHSGGYIDAGISVGNPMGTGFGHQGGLCGMSCVGSGMSSQYMGLPNRLPRQIIQHQVPMMPNIQGGWVSGGPGMGNPWMGGPGMGGMGFPVAQPIWFVPGSNCGPSGMMMGGGGFGPSMMGPPMGGGFMASNGGQTIIDMRTPAEWERNDTAAIVWGVSAGLSTMNSNVYPVAYPRQDITIPPMATPYQGPRSPGFAPRPGGSHNGSF